MKTYKKEYIFFKIILASAKELKLIPGVLLLNNLIHLNEDQQTDQRAEYDSEIDGKK